MLNTAFCGSDGASLSITSTRVGTAVFADSVLVTSLIGPIAVPLAMPIGLIFKLATEAACPVTYTRAILAFGSATAISQGSTQLLVRVSCS